MKRCLFIHFFLFLYLLAAAQQPVLYFKKINSSNGLSNNKVNCVLQDKRGFIWIGTDDGLNRYDGNNFLVFRNKPGTAGISGNIITALYQDKKDIIWIATADGGLSKYDFRLSPEKQFKQFKNQPGNAGSIPVNVINALVEDEFGYLWLATSGKRVLRFNKQTEKFDSPIDKGTTTALSLCIDNKKTLWVGRQGGGLLSVNTQTLQYSFDQRYNDLYAKLPHAVVTSLFMDSKKNMWFGSWDKILYRYHAAEGKEESFIQSPFAHSFQNDEIANFAEDKNGNIWMAGHQHGLHVFNSRLSQFYNYRFNPALEGTIADNTVNCVFIDRDNTIWVGTNKGISISKLEQQFVQQFLPGTLSNGSAITIYDFYEDNTQTLWIATSNGVYAQKMNDASLAHMPVHYKGEKIAVTKFFKDEDGAMYFGTNYSLFRYNQHSRQLEALEDRNKDQVMNHIIASRVVSVIRDTINQHPVLLTSPYGHFLAYYDLVDKKWVSRLDSSQSIVNRFGLTDNLIRKFYRTPDGTIWLAMGKDGLGEWNKTPHPQLVYYKNSPTNPASITNNNVFDLTSDSLGNLWVSTAGGGLLYFSTADKTFRHITHSPNLLEGIQTDNKGNVWLIANGNLHKYNPSINQYAVFEVPDIEKSGGIKGYIYKTSSEKMFVAGANYFISFDPKTIINTGEIPEIFFTDFKIFENSFSHLLADKQIKLRHNQNYFTIEFAAPYYQGSEKVRYSYMLEGVDKDWVDAGTRNFASYPKTGSGTFVFKVKAAVGNGEWGSSISTIKIEVVPPFWKRWWFYAFCALLITAILYTIYRYRVNELLKRQTMRNKIAQDLHDNVGSTLSSIAVYSQVAQIQADGGNKQQLNEVLDKISSTSNAMITEMNDIVWAINPANDNMEKIVGRMESFARPLLAARNIHFNFTCTEEAVKLNLDMEGRKNFFLIFKEAVNNAIKYSGASEITIIIAILHRQLHLSVKDNGIGFNKAIEIAGNQSPSGNGLHNMQTRAAEMKGSLVINSQPGTGTEIVLAVPLG